MTAIIMLAIIAETAIAFPRSITSSLLDIPFETKGKQVEENLASRSISSLPTPQICNLIEP
jgi:hypothetical protein